MTARLILLCLCLLPWLCARAIGAESSSLPNASAASNHWAFRPVRAGAPPAVRFQRWPQNPIDRFLLARLEEHHLAPASPASRHTLLRRVTYDLTGLPPRPEEIEAFLSDNGEGAFGRVVERLLASPQYGEQWGRHWLDLVRYADTAGENTDHPVPQAWRYRNWVIAAFNRNQPYDEFLRDQIAGDLRAAQAGDADGYAERVVATGFLAIARRFGHDIDQDMHLTREDTIDTLGKAVLGLTLGCARCHDHKYDPVSSRDYYALYGIFESTKFTFPGCEPKQMPRDLVPLLPAGEVERLRGPFAAEQAQRDAEVKRLEAELAAGPSSSAPPPRAAALAEAKARRDAQRRLAPIIPVAYAAAEGKPQDARLQQRGDPMKPGEWVPRRWLEWFGGARVAETNSSGRQELAAWVTSAANPLLARVLVNRIWQHHFGLGLVATPNDFGLRGQAPTHPELLDWLADAFVRSGWSHKAMHRLILNSAAYQMASVPERVAEGGAPARELYAVFPRRRLSAEELRDTLLALSGELDATPGAGHPFPPEEKWNFTQHAPFAADYANSRRSVYLMQKRNRRAPFFALFDGADPNASTPVRDHTIVPTQALFFMNDPFAHEQARKFAARVLNASANELERVDDAFEALYGRCVTDVEQDDAMAFLAAYAAQCGDASPETRRTLAWEAYVRVLFASNELVYLD
jgi:hypothetical protein